MKLRTASCLMILSRLIYGSDVQFASGRHSLGIPFESANDVIYLRASVNDSPPLTFLLDTGASYSLLHLRHAKSLGLELQPLGKVEGGFGAEPPDAYLATDSVSIALPGVVFQARDLRAVALDMVQECIDRAAASEKAPTLSKARIVDGILGADFFRSLVVEVDYAARRIHLYDPAAYRYQGAGKILPFDRQDYIFVRAQVTGPGHRTAAARLMVDTGASFVLSLTRQFAASHGILPPTAKLVASDNCGIGGSTKQSAWFGSLEALQLGAFRIPRPEAMFYEDDSPQPYEGALGGAAFRGAKVVFDYYRSRIIFAVPPKAERRPASAHR